VTSSPAGIDCGATCSARFVEGQVVSLSAVRNANSIFEGWSGACSGFTCKVTMSAARSATATFSVLRGGRVTNTTITATPKGNLIVRVLNPNSRPAQADLTVKTIKKYRLGGPSSPKRRVTLGHAKFAVGPHRTVSVTLHLSDKAQALLKREQKLTAESRLVFGVAGRTRTTVQTLTVKAPQGKRAR
jgi:hypothetical protein